MFKISISVIGRTMTSTNYDSEKRMKFLIYQYIIMLIQPDYSFIYVATEEAKANYKISTNKDGIKETH